MAPCPVMVFVLHRCCRLLFPCCRLLDVPSVKKFPITKFCVWIDWSVDSYAGLGCSASNGLLGGGLGSCCIGSVPIGAPPTPSLTCTGNGGSVVLVRLGILSSDQPLWNSHPSLAPSLPLIPYLLLLML